MRRAFFLTAALGAALLPCASIGLAQSQGTNLGTPRTQPQPGGSAATGPGAPTSALPSAGGAAGTSAPALPSAGGMGPVDAATQGRGPPPLGSVTGSSQIGPTGAITPGAEGAEPGTGGSQSNSTP